LQQFCAYIYLYIYIYTYIYIYIYIYIYMCVCVCVCVSVCLCVCLYTYTYTHVYIYIYAPHLGPHFKQVHRATLKTGEEVVLKVQRENLRKLFDVDLFNIR